MSFFGSEYSGLVSVVPHSPPLSFCFFPKDLPSLPPVPRKNYDTYCVIFLRAGVLGVGKGRERVLGGGTLVFLSFSIDLSKLCFVGSWEFLWLTSTSNAKEWSSRKGTWSACSKARIIAGTEPLNS